MAYLGWSRKKYHAIYEGGIWKDSTEQPFIEASSTGVQYAQSVIEGMKAYKRKDGKLVVFRLNSHYERLNLSLEKLKLPLIAFDFFFEAIKNVVTTKGQWDWPLASEILYLRPIVYGLGGEVFPKSSKKSGFSIYTAPVGNFRKDNCTIEFFDLITRTSINGLNFAKTSLNYSPIISKPFENTSSTDIWYDPMTGYIEEADTANIFFVTHNEIITPSLDNRVLAGITRDSIIEIIKNSDVYKIIERDISVEEVMELSRNNLLHDCFMTSTGIGIQKVNNILFDNKLYDIKSPNKTSSQLEEEYLNTIFGDNEKYKKWRHLI